tara:strand:- start:356 stop:568 length:213 start_codon:yes stop_codon:yes gene_type:complete
LSNKKKIEASKKHVGIIISVIISNTTFAGIYSRSKPLKKPLKISINPQIVPISQIKDPVNINDAAVFFII